MHDTDPHSSLFAVKMLSETEVWAAGGHPTPGSDFEGRFWHSLDGGLTWAKTAFPGTYIVSMDMQAKSGYAVALTDSNPAGLKLFKYTAKEDEKVYRSVEDVFGPTNGCSNPGHCGRAYQACCAAFAAKGFPCQCHLAPGDGESGKCGDCGTGFAACCIGYKAKGFPCTCDVQ